MWQKIILHQKEIDEIKKLIELKQSIQTMMKLLNRGRKPIVKVIKQLLGEDGYKTYAKISMHSGTAKYSFSFKPRKFKALSEEHKRKISESNKGKKLSDVTRAKISASGKSRFERGTWTLEKFHEAMQKAKQTKINNGYYKLHGINHSKWMLKNAPMKNKTHSQEAKNNMKLSKQNFFKNGGKSSFLGKKHSENVKFINSIRCTKMWQDGKFDYGKNGMFRSKIEIKIYEEFLTYDKNSIHSKRINTFIYDIYSPKLNLLIEVNGDFWHYNPKFYDLTYDNIKHKRKNSVKDVWERDQQKIQLAKKSGFNTITIWEDDIKNIGIKNIVQEIYNQYLIKPNPIIVIV